MFFEALDIALFEAIHPKNCDSNFWSGFWLFLSDYSKDIWLVFVLAIAMRMGKVGWFPALIAISGFLVAWHLSDEWLKPFFNRARPFDALGNCVIGRMPKSMSFPSGHELTAATVAYLVFATNKNTLIKWSAVLLACAIGYSRVYLGVHYPTDILGGAVFGILIGFIWLKIMMSASENYFAKEDIQPSVKHPLNKVSTDKPSIESV